VACGAQRANFDPPRVKFRLLIVFNESFLLAIAKTPYPSTYLATGTHTHTHTYTHIHRSHTLISYAMCTMPFKPTLRTDVKNRDRRDRLDDDGRLIYGRVAQWLGMMIRYRYDHGSILDIDSSFLFRCPLFVLCWFVEGARKTKRCLVAGPEPPTSSKKNACFITTPDHHNYTSGLIIPLNPIRVKLNPIQVKHRL
jgi:hypothetical protein